MIEDCGGIFGLVSPWPWIVGRLFHSPNIVGDFGYGWDFWQHGRKLGKACARMLLKFFMAMQIYLKMPIFVKMFRDCIMMKKMLYGLMAGLMVLASGCDGDKNDTDNKPGVVDLSAVGTANCYIVPAAGTYSFKMTQGNGPQLSGVASAEVLWESFGDKTVPEVGSIIKSVSVDGDAIRFETPEELKNGNALIAAKNEYGTILWSWHIWVCKDYDPVATAHVYNNNAGTMMDRNLGATSTTQNAVQSLGLMYQWGRKDPFLGPGAVSYASASEQAPAASTIVWPDAVLNIAGESGAKCGSIEFSINYPTTFILHEWYKDKATTIYDWCLNMDVTRWLYVKTKYDPCPAGWQVPKGGEEGVWYVAYGDKQGYAPTLEHYVRGLDFSNIFGGKDNWYPATGCISGSNNNGNTFEVVGESGYLWSCTWENGTRDDRHGGRFFYYNRTDGYFKAVDIGFESLANANGLPVRCVKTE